MYSIEEMKRGPKKFNNSRVIDTVQDGLEKEIDKTKRERKKTQKKLET